MGLKAGPTSSAGGVGGGQSNTISSDGGGLGITSTVPKVGVDLRVRSLAATLPLSVAQAADLITLTIALLVNADIAAGAAIALSKLATIEIHFGSVQSAGNANTDARFLPAFATFTGASSTEANNENHTNAAFTLRAVSCFIVTNSKVTDSDFAFRDDSVDIGATTISALTTGLFETTGLSTVVASGSDVCWRQTGTGAGTLRGVYTGVYSPN